MHTKNSPLKVVVSSSLKKKYIYIFFLLHISLMFLTKFNVIFRVWALI